MVEYLAQVKCKLEGFGLTDQQFQAWYRKFKKDHNWSLQRVTTHRRKVYEGSEKERVIALFKKFVRDLKLKNDYPAELILNFGTPLAEEWKLTKVIHFWGEMKSRVGLICLRSRAWTFAVEKMVGVRLQPAMLTKSATRWVQQWPFLVFVIKFW